MATTPADPPAVSDRQWFIVSRWQELQGEARANLLRSAAVAAFYLVELLHYHALDLGFLHLPEVLDRRLHLALTALVVAWAALAVGVQVCLQLRIFPAWLKYLSTGGDVLLLTCVLLVGSGPRSPLVVAYFLLLALAALRFSLGLIWFTTIACAAGYLCVLGYARWFAEGRDLAVPRFHQLLFLLGLALTGVILGQVVRRIRALAHDYAHRLRATSRNPT